MSSKPLAIVVAASLSGCATFNAVEYNAKEHEKVITRASFDLSCPRAELQLTDLAFDEYDPGKGAVNAVGVSGCGKKATYNRIFTGNESTTWVNNAASASKQGAAPPEE